MTDSGFNSRSGSVRVVFDGAVTWATLTRESAANSLGPVEIEDLLQVVARAESDDACRVLVISGLGRFFCAGGDVRFMSTATSLSDAVEQLVTGLNRLADVLARTRLLTIARVNGTAAGAGVSLALNCDLIIAEENARFVSAYSDIGFSPDFGLSYLLPKRIGDARTVRFCLGGERLDAATAREWGLVDLLQSEADFSSYLEGLVASLGRTTATAQAQTLQLVVERRQNVEEYRQHLSSEARSVISLAQESFAEHAVAGLAR